MINLWEAVIGRVRLSVGDEIYNNFFERMVLENIQDDTVHISVPTQFLKSWIQRTYGQQLHCCVIAVWPHVKSIVVTVRSVATPCGRVAQLAPPSAVPTMHSLVQEAAKFVQSQTRATLAPSPAIESALDPRLTFETFVGGRTTTLAIAACKDIASSQRSDPVQYNPLYIHAGIGLGKTHLLHALAWASNKDGVCRAYYLTAERFMYGFVMALKSQTTIAFKEMLRAVDILIIDDLQFLKGKSVQAELSHTLSAFMDSGHRIVLSADRHPNDLEAFDDRMRSRLSNGLVIELGALSREQKMEILCLRIKAMQALHNHFNVPIEVMEFVVDKVIHNGRDVEGALNKLLALCTLSEHTITLELAERELQGMIRGTEPKRVKIEDIQRVVARQYNVSRTDLLSSRRTANVVRPRQVAMYLAKTLTLRSLPEIGRRFGGRDHTTVLHAVRKITGLVDKDTSLSDEVDMFKRELEAHV